MGVWRGWALPDHPEQMVVREGAGQETLVLMESVTNDFSQIMTPIGPFVHYSLATVRPIIAFFSHTGTDAFLSQICFSAEFVEQLRLQDWEFFVFKPFTSLPLSPVSNRLIMQN